MFKVGDRIKYRVFISTRIESSEYYNYGVIVRQDPAGYSNGLDCWIVQRPDKTRFACSPGNIELCNFLDELLYF